MKQTIATPSSASITAETAQNKVPKKPKLDKIELSSDDSFPCSDPPGWIKVHATPDYDEEEDDITPSEKQKDVP